MLIVSQTIVHQGPVDTDLSMPQTLRVWSGQIKVSACRLLCLGATHSQGAAQLQY